MPPPPKKKRRPSGPIKRVYTYDLLSKYVDNFVNGNFPLVILVGGHGLGKSAMFRRAFDGKECCWMEGNATSFGMYERLYNHLDCPVVIDDVDGLCFDKGCVSLLKSLCQTDEVKQISWHANERYLEGRGLPAEFATKSSVVVITNDWRTLNRNVSALEDRGVVVHFEPTVEEVHRRAAGWFKDREIHDWFGENLHRIEVPSFRHYIRAAQSKSAQMDWKDVLGDLPRGQREALAAAILADPSFEGSEARARAFELRGGGSRKTFFNYKRKIEARP